MEVYPPEKLSFKAMEKMQVSTILFEFYRPGEARAESEHRGEHDGGAMFLELQAFLQPLAVLSHVQLPLLGSARYP